MALYLFLFVFFSIVSFFWGRIIQVAQRLELWERTVTGTFSARAVASSSNWGRQVDEMAEFLGRPEWGILVRRGTILLPILGFGISALLQQPIGFLGALALGTLPYLWLHRRTARGWRALEQQLREFRLVLGYLVKAGAPLDRAVYTATQSVDFPLRPYLEDVCRDIGWGGAGEAGAPRLETVLTAFRKLSHRVKSREMLQLTQLLEMSAQHTQTGSVGDKLLRALEVEEGRRDTEASKQYDAAQLKIDLVSMLTMGAPVEIYVLVVAMSLMGNTGAGSVLFGGSSGF